jgi:PAS domain S-box-containing protein
MPTPSPATPSASPETSGNLFQLLFERSGDAILLLDGQTSQFVDCNQAALTMLRAASKAEVLATHPSRLSPEHQPDGQLSFAKANENIEAAIKAGTLRFEWIHRRMDGTDFPVEVLLTAAQFGDQPLIVTVWRDISERKRVEEALRQSESKFRRLFERSSDPILLLSITQDGFSEFIDCNQSTLDLLGYDTKDRIIGKSPVDISPAFQPGDRESEPTAAKIFGEFVVRGYHRFEWTHTHRDGSSVPVEVSLTNIVEEGAAPVVVVIWRDIAERKRNEAAIRELNASLQRRSQEIEQANGHLRTAETQLRSALANERELGQLKSNFVSMVSHELRTPLGVIGISAQVLQRYLNRLEDGERAVHLQAITDNVQRMAAMMENVLIFSRVDSEHMDFRPASIKLEPFCRALADEMRSATGASLPVEFEWEASLPATAAADENLVRHILVNLLSNAVKYSPPGQAARLAVRREGDWAIFAVSDRGIGIPESDRARLFQTFQRGTNVGRVAGTGLGLVIVKRCCELHGGEVSVDSVVGEGSTFTVKLPLFAPRPIPATTSLTSTSSAS